MLATKGQNLGSVAPELEVMKQRQQDAAGGGEPAGGAAGGWQKSASGQWIGGEVGSPAARSAWQLKEEEAQRVRVRTTPPVALPLQAADSWVRGLFTWCVLLVQQDDIVSKTIGAALGGRRAVILSDDEECVLPTLCERVSPQDGMH